jgi:glyoxylase-like metal-dependent hydrolase (beta-lactamase superfamily II)
MTDFEEVADRVWVARYEWIDLNITAIKGERGLVVVDTHGSTAMGRVVLDDLRRLGMGPVSRVINSHWHWDHTYGNAAFRDEYPDVPIHAHEEAARWLAEHGDEPKQYFADDPDDPHREDVMATEIVIPDQTFTDTHAVDLGDRLVELAFLGRAHTSGDIVIRVADANVVIAADLIEESDHPWIGRDSWPLEWPDTLDSLLALTGERTVIIPGHGAVVNRSFVQIQRGEIAQIAATIRQLKDHGVPPGRAAAEGDWPWDVDVRINNAITRGYEALSLP